MDNVKRVLNHCTNSHITATAIRIRNTREAVTRDKQHDFGHLPSGFDVMFGYQFPKRRTKIGKRARKAKQLAEARK